MAFNSHADKSDRAEMVFIRRLMKEPMLDRQEEQALSQAWNEHRDEKSLQRLVNSYTRLVISTAIRYRHFGLPVSDIIQEGIMGLMQAALRFEPQRDVRFSTYAKWWIRSSIQDYVLRNWSIVRTGSTSAQRMLFFNLRRLRAKLADIGTEQLSEGDVEKICEVLHVTKNEVKEMEGRLSGHDLSLNSAVAEDASDNWMDFLVDERPDPEDTAIEHFDETIRKHWIRGAMKQLSPREKTIITARRLYDSPLTLESLGKKLKISKERVRQIEAKAIRKMRFHLLRNIHDKKELL